MLTEPQAVTVSGTAYSLPLVTAETMRRVYQDTTGSVALSTAKSDGRTKRRSVSAKQTKTASDPFVAGLSKKSSANVSVTFTYEDGFWTVAELIALYTGLIAQLDAATKTVATKVAGGEL